MLTPRPGPCRKVDIVKIPAARGEASAALFRLLSSPREIERPEVSRLQEAVGSALQSSTDTIADEDLQLVLFCLYEMHYSGLDDTDPDWEWDPRLLAVRVLIERSFEAELRRVADTVETEALRGLNAGPAPDAEAVAQALFGLVAADEGPSVSRYIGGKATGWQLQEFLIHKSVYQLKEADPHTWAIPRLQGRAKAAMVEIQADEYGGGRAPAMHSALFARTMRAAGLDDTIGAYLNHVPGQTLASVNMMSLFGLHRRLRGAICGHLAVYEMSSSIPNKHYARGFRKHGYDDNAVHYFDEHVEADAVHEQIAGRDLAGGLVEAEPHLLDDVIFGARAALAIDSRQGQMQLDAWTNGRTSLLAPVPGAGREPMGAGALVASR